MYGGDEESDFYNSLLDGIEGNERILFEKIEINNPYLYNREPIYRQLHLFNNNNNYSKTIKIYNDFFDNFKDTTDIEIYRQLYDYFRAEIDQSYIDSLQTHINNSILSHIDFYNALNFYNSLNKNAKLAYAIHKSDSKILTYIFRKKTNTIDDRRMIIDYIQEIKRDLLRYNPHIDMTLKYLLLDNEIKPLLKIYNIIYNLYKNVPKIEKQFIVYRAEKIYTHDELIIEGNEYIMKGYTSCTTDPRVGYAFNKILICTSEFPRLCTMPKVFIITIPVNAQVLIPGINRTKDPEFEILLNNNSKIKINKIKTDVVKNIIDTENVESQITISKLIYATLIIPPIDSSSIPDIVPHPIASHVVSVSSTRLSTDIEHPITPLSRARQSINAATRIRPTTDGRTTPRIRPTTNGRTTSDGRPTTRTYIP